MATTKTRRICIMCGCKRVIDQMKSVGIKHGRYFQADKEITGYVCTRKGYVGNEFISESCAEKYEAKEKHYSPYHEPIITKDS